MAKDRKKIIEIDTSSASESIEKLKKEIDSLKESIGKLDKSTDEYKKSVKELEDTEKKLDSLLKTSKKDFKDVSDSTKASATTIKDLRKEIGTLRDSLLNMTKGSIEYNKTLEQIKINEERINEVMRATKKEVDALPGSYNELTQSMAKLKREWKETNDESRRNELGKQILDVNTKLKELDASTGNFQRNVGDYKNAFVQAFTSIITGAETSEIALQGLKSTMVALSQDPVAIAGIALAAFGKIKNALVGNEKFMSGLKKGLGETGTITGWVKDQIGKLGDKLGELIYRFRQFASSGNAAFKFIDVKEQLRDIEELKYAIEKLNEIRQKESTAFDKLSGKQNTIYASWKQNIDEAEKSLKILENSINKMDFYKPFKETSKEVVSLINSYKQINDEIKQVKENIENIPITEEARRNDELTLLIAKIKELGDIQKKLGDYNISSEFISDDFTSAINNVSFLNSKIEMLNSSLASAKAINDNESIKFYTEELKTANEELEKHIETIELEKTAMLAEKGSYKQITDEITKYEGQIKSITQIEDQDGKQRELLTKKVDILRKAQEKLDNQFKKSEEEIKVVSGSYQELKNKLEDLRKKWEEVGTEAERGKLEKEIKKVSSRMDEMSASMNQGSSMFISTVKQWKEGLISLRSATGVAVKETLGLIKAFAKLALTPVGAVIMAIVAAVKLLKLGFNNSEDASNKLKVAFAALEPVINSVKNAATWLANAVGDIVGKIGELISKFNEWRLVRLKSKLEEGKISQEEYDQRVKNIEATKKATQTTIELANREIELIKRKRKFQVEEAKSELEVSELRSKAAEKDKYTQTERKKFLEDAKKAEERIASERLAIAQEEYDILKRKSELTDNDAETNNKLAEAEANLYKTKKTYYDKIRELNSGIAEASKTTTKVVKEESDEMIKVLEKLDQNEWDAIAKIQKRIEDSGKTELQKLEEKFNAELYLLERWGEDTTGLYDEYEKAKTKILEDEANKRIEARKKEVEDSVNKVNDNYSLEAFISEKTETNPYRGKEKQLDLNDERLEGLKAIYEAQLELDDLSIEEKEKYKDELARIDAEIVENSRNRQDLERAIIEKQIDDYSMMANSIGDLMGAVSDIWTESIERRQKNGQITEKQAKQEFEQMKKLQIAQAVITGLSGVATAIATAMELGPILGPIMGAINAATVTATTIAQIAKIKNTEYGSSSSSSSAVSKPSTEGIVQGVDYTRNITTETEEEILNQPMKVYVLESDITDAQNRVKVRETESSF